MLTTLVISLFGINLGQTIHYTNYNTPQVRKEIVIEEPEPAIPLEVVEPPKEKYNVNCFCVSYLRQFIPELPRQDAKDFVNNDTPAVGRLALFKYNKINHIALITSLESKGFWVKEANYIPCEKSERFIRWDDKAISGFHNPILSTNKKNTMTEENVDETVATPEDEVLKTSEEEVEAPEVEKEDE